MIQSIQAKALTLFVVLVIVFSTAIFVYKSSNPTVLGVQEVQTKKVKIGCLKVTICLSTFIAQEKGYFKAQNIEMDYVNFESPAAVVDALISGNIDVAGGAPTSVAAIAYSKDPSLIKIINGAYVNKDFPADVLVVTTDSKANSLADLKGKKVSILAGAQAKAMFIYTAKQQGLNPSQVGGNGDIFYQDQAASDQLTSLQSEKVDAIFAVEPVGSQAESMGIGRILGQSPISTALGYNYWISVGLINQKFAKENPQIAQKVINSYDQAIDDIQQNPNSQRQYLEKYLGLKEPVLSKVALPANKKSTELKDQDIEEIQKLINLFQEQGVVKTKVDVKDMIYKD
jgi:ABC-type nitrate/sulfonate/bicarbonate transport system substrate-binding protein